MEVNQCTLVTLDNGSQRHANSSCCCLSIDTSGDSCCVNGSCRHLHHALEAFCLCKAHLVKVAKLKWHHNLSRIAIRDDCLAGTNLKLGATRHPCTVHSHHWVDSESQGINTSTKFSIQSLLAVIALLTNATSPEASGNNIPREGNQRTVLHHVGVFFHLQELTTVSHNNNGFYIFAFFVQLVLFRAFFLAAFLFRLWQVHCLVEFFTRNKTIILGQTHLIVLVNHQVLVRLKVLIRSCGCQVDITVDTLLNEDFHLMFRDKLINSHAQSLFNRGGNRVNQEVLWQNRTNLHHCTRLHCHTNSLHGSIKDGLCSWCEVLHLIKDKFSHACAKHGSV